MEALEIMTQLHGSKILGKFRSEPLTDDPGPCEQVAFM